MLEYCLSAKLLLSYIYTDALVSYVVLLSGRVASEGLVDSTVG